MGFGVMQKNIPAADDLLDSIQQHIVQQHLGENGRVVLKAVNGQHLIEHLNVQESLKESLSHL